MNGAHALASDKGYGGGEEGTRLGVQQQREGAQARDGCAEPEQVMAVRHGLDADEKLSCNDASTPHVRTRVEGVHAG